MLKQREPQIVFSFHHHQHSLQCMDARQNKQAQKSKPSLFQFLYKKIFESISVKEESTTLSGFLNNKSDVGLNLLFLKELKTSHWDILTRISWLHHTHYSAVNNPSHSSHLLLLLHPFQVFLYQATYETFVDRDPNAQVITLETSICELVFNM